MDLRTIARIGFLTLIVASPVAAVGCSGSSPTPGLYDRALGQRTVGLPPIAAAHSPAVLTQKHVLTWDVLWDGANGDTAVTGPQAAPWLDWVMVDAAHSANYHSAGIKTMYYTQPNRQAPGDPEYSDLEATFAHDCNHNRIATTNYKGHYLMNPASSALGQLWQNEVILVTTQWGGQYDAIYEDLTDTIVYTSAKPCGFDQTSWSTASNSLSNYVKAAGLSVIYNGLAVTSGTGDGVSSTMAMNASTMGGMFEGCYTSTGAFPRLHNKMWIDTENTEIAMATAGKLFFCRGLQDTDAASSMGDRLYQYASFMLTKNRTSSVLGESFKTPDKFSELPESELVATQPVQTGITDISQLLQSSGVYGRQYNACYIGGVLVGPCAAVVSESTGPSLPFPWPTQYHHTIVLTGEDILGGGTIAANGPPPPSTVGPLTAIIAFQ